MAGIGFELKRIFKQEGLSSIIAGAAYSTLVVIGPTIMVMLTLADFICDSRLSENILYRKRITVVDNFIYICFCFNNNRTN